jgi:CheY-like chemotaxis protein
MATAGPLVLALVPDLFFLSRLRAAAEARGAKVEVVRRADRLAGRAIEARPALVIVDMGTRGEDWAAAIRALRADPAGAALPVVAFGPHVDQEAQSEARAAGASRVLSNSRFTETLPDLLAGYV